jgi:hypothetical protein
MKMSHLAAATATTLCLAAASAGAQSLPIVGGFTSVALVSAPTLSAAGLSVSGLGSALISPGSGGIPVAYFPVTGGTLNTASFAGSIQHTGSGLSLSSSTATLNLTNFVIDTVGGILSGQAAVVGGSNLGSVPLFTLGSSGNPAAPFSLSLTATAAGALSSVFGIPNLTGALIGNANTLPITAAVPEPSTALSMLAGLGLIGASLFRRRAANDAA